MTGKDAIKGLPVVDSAVWVGAEIDARNDWLYQLSETEIDGLVSMARTVRQKIGDDPNALLTTTAQDFDLGVFANSLTEIRHDLKDGLGLGPRRSIELDDALGDHRARAHVEYSGQEQTFDPAPAEHCADQQSDRKVEEQVHRARTHESRRRLDE